MLAYMDYIMLYSLLMGHSLDVQRVWYVGMVFWNPPVEKGAKHPIIFHHFLGLSTILSVVYVEMLKTISHTNSQRVGGVRRPLPGVPPMPHRCGPWCKWRPRRGCRWGLGRDGNLFEKGNETWWVGKLNGLYGFICFIHLFVCSFSAIWP